MHPNATRTREASGRDPGASARLGAADVPTT